jgi:hypothetical protein
MVCPCCVKYCHAPSPCQKEIRIRATWGPVTGVSTLVFGPQGANGACGTTSGGLSGTGRFSSFLGRCTDTGQNPHYDATASIQIGWSQNAFGLYTLPSCCRRTGQRTAEIFGGGIGCLIDHGPQYSFGRQRAYHFSFASLDAAAVVTQFGVNDVGGTTPCGEALWQDFFQEPPEIELIVTGNPPDFCDRSEFLGGFPAVSGPYGTNVQCLASCGNPLP